MEPKQIFIQLNEESQFDAVKITRQLNNAEDRVDRQRKGLLASIKMNFGKTSPEFLKDLNLFYQSREIPLLGNGTVLMIHKKWRINKSIFNVLKTIFVNINHLGLIDNNEFTEKTIRYIELDPHSNAEVEKFKVWLTCQIILKIYTQGNVNKLDQFISAIWSNKNVPYIKLVPSVFKPKLADSHFKTIWEVFSIFKKKQAPPEIYLTFFNDFIIKISDKILAEKDFLTFLEFLFNKNKIEIVRGLSFTDYRRLYELKKINEGLFNKMPDLSKTDIEYNHKDRTSAHRPGIRLVYNLLIEYGVSHLML